VYDTSGRRAIAGNEFQPETTQPCSLVRPQVLPGVRWIIRPQPPISTSARAHLAECSADHEQRDPNARMEDVEQEILFVDVVDEAVVGKQPVSRPGVEDDKPVSDENKSGLPRHNRIRYDHPVRRERMLAAEISPELWVGNVGTLARRADLWLPG
jgi:hypothetical protein